jgi:hypothetical protein
MPASDRNVYELDNDKHDLPVFGAFAVVRSEQSLIEPWKRLWIDATGAET